MPKISIHSANVAARVRMENAVKKIEYMSNQIDVLELNKLFSKLEEISKDGYSVIIKIDSERWADFPPAPYTTIMFSPSGNNFKMDSSNVIEGIKSCIDYYENNMKK